MQEVRYAQPANFSHRGRNGLMKAHGIAAQRVGDEVFLQAIVNEGRVSDGARLVVPVDHVRDVVRLLEAQL